MRIMLPLVNLVLRFTDLLEAEGRAARRALAELVVAGVVLALACTLGVLACVAFACALALALWPVMPPPVALGVVGAALALAGWLTATAGRRMARPER